jgi:hypothetical protein
MQRLRQHTHIRGDQAAIRTADVPIVWNIVNRRAKVPPPISDQLLPFFTRSYLNFDIVISKSFKRGYRQKKITWIVELLAERFTVMASGSDMEDKLANIDLLDIQDTLDGLQTRDILDCFTARWQECGSLDLELYKQGALAVVDDYERVICEVETITHWLLTHDADTIPKTFAFFDSLRLWKHQRIYFLRNELFLRYHRTIWTQWENFIAGVYLWQRWWRNHIGIREMIRETPEYIWPP